MTTAELLDYITDRVQAELGHVTTAYTTEGLTLADEYHLGVLVRVWCQVLDILSDTERQVGGLDRRVQTCYNAYKIDYRR